MSCWLPGEGSFYCWLVSCICRGLSCSKWWPPWCTGLCLSWKMNRLLLAAMAMMLSVGCHAVCRIFFLKSRLSTLISLSLLFFPTHTRRGRRTARRLQTSRLASKVTSRWLARSNIRKKLLYAPVMMTLEQKQGQRKEYGHHCDYLSSKLEGQRSRSHLSVPFQAHSNLSKMQSLS